MKLLSFLHQGRETWGALVGTDALLPDGAGIAIAARMHGERLAANLNGTDLVPELCGRLAAMGCSVYLLGGQPGVAEAAAKAACPGLKLAPDAAEEALVARAASTAAAAAQQQQARWSRRSRYDDDDDDSDDDDINSDSSIERQDQH